MKIWNGYGSEHSLNLVLIGRFKEVAAAKEFEGLVNEVVGFLSNNPEFSVGSTEYDSETLSFLGSKNLFCLSPEQLGHLLYDYSLESEGTEIKVTSDDDLNAFVSLLIHKGAKVEVFSAHDYPDTNK